jgi:hypothetical protein
MAWGTAFILAGAVAAQAQATITSADMFNQVGQYYRAYANATNNTRVNVGAMLGSVGGPQAWDFTTGPADMIYRFDYLAATNTPNGAAFAAAGAQLAEQKTDEAGTVATSWLYFTQDPTKGRLDYGFYDPSFSLGLGGLGGLLNDTTAENLFTPPLNDFPSTMHYGDQWNSSTVYTNLLTFGDPTDPTFSTTVIVQFNYSAVDNVDAYGVANSPGIGFGDCLRVNELVTYDIQADFQDGSGFQPLETDYVRNYYWLRPGCGIVAQVTSQQSNSTPPDNNFSTATAILRMFETNHAETGTNQPGGGIQGLKITLGKTGALLQWTALPAASSYRVDYTTNLINPVTWLAVATNITANYLVDPAPAGTNAPVRFYRVVGN